MTTVVDLETLGPPGLDPGSERYVRGAQLACAVGRAGRAAGTPFVALVPGAEPGLREFVTAAPVAARVEYLDDPAEFARRLELGPWHAHNATGFDARVWAALGYPAPPGGWADTLPAARRLGFPGALALLGERITGRGKWGGEALAELSVPRAGQADLFAEPDARILDRVVAYCAHDVALLADCLADGGLLDDLERAERTGEAVVWRADQAVQARGFPADRELAEALRMLDFLLLEKRGRAAETATGEDAALYRSPKRLGAFLAARGHHVGDVRRATLEDVADETDDAGVRAVLDARLAEARVHRGKLAALLEDLDEPGAEGRVRRWGTYYAAHTGRWGGRRFQPHNLPRPFLRAGEQKAAVAAALAGDLATVEALAAAAGRDPSDVLASLLRAVVAAPEGRRLVVADLAQVEARVLLWSAGDAAGLAEFRAGDPYALLAEKLDGRPAPTAKDDPRRRLAKVMTLGLGYGTGAAKFGELAAGAGVDLAAVGLTPETAVARWRAARPRVVSFWRNLEDAWIAAAEGGSARRVGPVRFDPAGAAVTATLPSGRRLWYREPARDGDGRWSHALARGGRGHVWGGVLTENAVSGIARDLLGAALVELEARGLATVLHVHDEVLVEVAAEDAEDARAAVEAVLAKNPPWAPALPLAAEARVAERWG